jgi:CRP-like cAMP-binding protein
MQLTQHIASILPLSKELEQAIKKASKNVKLTKGENILEKGARCSHLYFTESGLLRGYYFDESKEITHWFAREGEFATGFYSFISKEPSFEYIQALEDCLLTQITYPDLQKLYATFPETERLGRIITENYYLKLEERLLSLQFKTAKERYNSLLERNPKLLQRVALGQIASYLGITQETLSRIRAEG